MSLPRSCEKSIYSLLKKFPCVAIIGARQVGKTTLLKRLRPKSDFFDLEKTQDFQRIQADPDFFLSQFDKCIVIDESQNLPSLFPALRVKIDQNRKRNGQFLISGSRSPSLLKSITESLAGRIAIFELTPFSIYESWRQPLSDLPKRLKQSYFKLPSKPRFSVQQIHKSFLHGGYPDAFLARNDQTFFKNWMNNYMMTYLKRDIRNLFPSLNILAYQRFLSMLADTSGDAINYSQFARSLSVSQPTVRSYFQIAEGAFFWRMLLSFKKNVQKRITSMPKGYVIDSGLNHFLLNIHTKEQLYSSRKVGFLWQAFVTEQIIRIFKDQYIPHQVYHYQTHNGGEIDLLMEGDFGLLPIEIKLGTSASIKGLKSLSQFLQEHKIKYGLLINNAQKPCWLTPQIAQIPITYL